MQALLLVRVGVALAICPCPHPSSNPYPVQYEEDNGGEDERSSLQCGWSIKIEMSREDGRAG